MKGTLDSEGPLSRFHVTWLHEQMMLFDQDAVFGKWDTGWISAFIPQWDFLMRSTTSATLYSTPVPSP